MSSSLLAHFRPRLPMLSSARLMRGLSTQNLLDARNFYDAMNHRGAVDQQRCGSRFRVRHRRSPRLGMGCRGRLCAAACGKHLLEFPFPGRGNQDRKWRMSSVADPTRYSFD